MNIDAFRHAPPATTIDGLQAAPIDITNVTATFVFDAATQMATAGAMMSFETGPARAAYGQTHLTLLFVSKASSTKFFGSTITSKW